jgi:tetratricopeptide (TPR) repeat protein
MKNIEKNQNEQIKKYYQLYKEGKWAEGRAILLELQKEYPDDHWLLTRISSTYYEEYNYDKALEYAERALDLAPDCPLVLWDYAGALDMIERDEEAIRVFKNLIHRGVNRIAYGECGEGIRWARSLLNDSRYRLGLLYSSKGDFSLACKFIKTYIANRNRNYPSIYNLRNAKRELAAILEGNDPRRE